MLNYFFGFLALVGLLSTFSMTFSFGGIHRTFLSLSRGVMETAVYPLVNTEGEYVLFYDPQMLETEVNDYLSAELNPYTESYWISFYYFYVNTQTPCGQTCDGVQIHLVVTLNALITYDNELRFELHSRGI